METFYVTTPIYYVNGSPHIGHAYTTIVADVLARYHRMRGDEVFFMTGTDEHGLKVQREAEKAEKTPKQLADENSKKFLDLFDRLELTHDRFIRTTDEDHKRVATRIFEAMQARGDIYLDTYEGWYAAADEAFYTEDEIQDGKAIESGAPVEWVSEASYFFKLSAYQDKLLAWYKENPNCIRPEARYNEVVSFVEGGLQDLSISRTTFDWGIPIPNDPNHIMYVWVDALTNYITGVGAFGEDDEAFKKFWPCSLHLLGKDILRFHCVFWPAFLMSAGLEPPEQLFVHGWWLVEGEKMSKRAGNWIDPNELIEQFPLDVIRYYLLREVPFGNDGNFVRDRLIERNNSELADNFGNLVNRMVKMVQRFTDGKAPAAGELTEDDKLLVEVAKKTWREVEDAFKTREFNRALEVTLSLSTELNQYVQRNQPWKLAKDETQKERLGQVLYNTLEGIRWVALLLSPVLPDASGKVLDALGIDEAARSFTTLEWGALSEGQEIGVPDVLFTKLEAPAKEKEEEPKAEAKAPKKKKEQKKSEEKSGKLDFKEFQKLEMKVGLIVSAEKVEGADKLLKLAVDVGEEQPRTVVAGIAKAYEPEALVGNRYAVVTNLKPAKIFGIKSEGMMLAADTSDGKLELARFSEAVAPGTRIS
jgi:methionyl-tRNA synthetase